ncbi:nitrate reductase [Alsobacter soli]|uniref:Nitrate reductase n=1 Tax=Alsobacter soli TaxID=2109933 RepID=A0A2T1HX86_9HYPH|nr:nitrate reductase [Alsobacter soli]PSC06306.1 nitrate reductase [Alsobacter soli]
MVAREPGIDGAGGGGPAPPATRTTCPYCGVGCGVLARREPDGRVTVQGDPNHPANRGRLCSKGSALAETLSLADRLLHPQVGGRRVGWDDALDLVASRFKQAIREHGPDSVAFYVSGQLLTEDYYVANKVMKGFIGSANIDTNSRLCMASAVAAHRRAFGSDTVPGVYADLEEAELVVLVGSNFAWCHPVLFQRLLAARASRGVRLVVIDPRRTATAEQADLHLPIAADSDAALFNGLLRHLDRVGKRDVPYTDAHVTGWPEAVAAAAPATLEAVAAATGCSAQDIARFYAEFAGADRVVTVFSQGVNQSVSGTDKATAILNCHLFTGRIGKPGASPFSITGQPNAMGGREVGGLATMLAAHMDLEDAAARERVQRFWGSPAIATRPGLKAVELFSAVREGRVKALWIMATNPADSLPDADEVQAALRTCPFVVVSDVTARTDTARFAHVLLPAAAWGEKNGAVTNSERRISRQRAFLPLPGEARPDWWALAAAARRMGFAGFDYEGPAAIFREHAALSAFENDGARAFDIGAHDAIGAAAYDALAPFQWPQRRGEPARDTRFFSEGEFSTPDGRARMTPVAVLAAVAQRADFPLTLNTGRIRDQWHTMTRTAKSPRLMAHYGEPFCEIHPADAARLGVAPDGIVRVTTEQGSVLLRALITDRTARGSVFAPMHWNDQFAGAGRVNALVSPATDPVSGQPGFKRTTCRAEPFPAAWFGFAVSATRPAPSSVEYWALAPATGGYRIELAGHAPPADWRAFAERLFGVEGEDLDWVAYHDRLADSIRLAAFAGERLVGALFAAPQPVALARGLLVEALAQTHAGSCRARLLAGLAAAGAPDRGTIVCACREVGAKQIHAAIRTGAANLDAIGERLGAGANCGSCRPEIQRLIQAARVAAPETRTA